MEVGTGEEEEAAHVVPGEGLLFAELGYLVGGLHAGACAPGFEQGEGVLETTFDLGFYPLGARARAGGGGGEAEEVQAVFVREAGLAEEEGLFVVEEGEGVREEVGDGGGEVVGFEGD